MKKILVISSYDLRRNTSSNIRTIALIQSLSENDCTVDVVYLQSSHEVDISLSNAIMSSCKGIFPLIEKDESVDNIKNNNKKDEQKAQNKVKKVLLNLYSRLFVYDVFQTQFKYINKKKMNNISNDYDIVISSSEPRSSHKLARLLIKKCGIHSRWVQYWGDPMTNDVASKKFLPFLEKKEEKRLLRKADIVLYTNPGCVKYMQKKYVFAEKKIFWIPTTDITMEEHICSNEIEVSYVGDYISRYRNIVPLYNACKKLNCVFTLAGNGDVCLENTEKILVLGRVNKDKANNIENNSNILVVIDNQRPNQGTCIQVPGKLYHYSLTNKYIIVISNSNELKHYYQKYNRFVFCANDEMSIIKTIETIRLGRYENSYHSPLKDFSHDEVYKRFVEIINETNR